jgi:hypothetical protein
MKHITLLFYATALFYSAAAQDGSAAAPETGRPSASAAAFSWATTVCDFGSIKAGIPVSFEFRFINTGMAPLVIASATASCGCTIAAYTKEPVEKDKGGVVRVSYNAAHTGKFSKTVVVAANIPEGPVILTIKGEVAGE